MRCGMFKNFSKKEKVILGVSLAVISIILLFVYIIHSEKFTSFFETISALSAVLNPILVGIIIAYLLNPIEKFFIKKVFKKVKSNKTHKGLSILCTYLLVLGLVSAFFLIAVPQVIDSINEMPSKLRDFAIESTALLEKYLTNVENSEFFSSIQNTFNIEDLDIEKILTDFATNLVNIEKIIQMVADSSIGILESTYVALKDFILGFIISIYMLAAKERLLANSKKITIALLGEEKAKNTFSLCKFTNQTFGGYIQGKLINAVIIGILTWIAFGICGVPYPHLLTIIITVTDLIPVFGPFIGAIPSAFIVLIAAPEKLIVMFALIILIQQIDGNYIGPKILGESTGLSALGVFLAITIMGGYFGIPGMLIGVPIFAVISALIEKSVNKKLAKDGHSTDIADYYSKYSLEDDDAQKHDNLFTKTVDFIIKYIKIAVLAIVGFFKNMPKIQKRQKIQKTESASKSRKLKSCKKQKNNSEKDPE